MPSSGRITVSILNGDTQADFEEHQIVTTATKTECWTESKERLQFSIATKIAPPSGDLFRYRFYVDGIWIEEVLLGNLEGTFYPRKIVSAVRQTQNESKPLIFGKTLFMEEGQSDEKFLDTLGTIQVKVNRVTTARKSVDQSFKPRVISESKGVTEKAKKALVTHSQRDTRRYFDATLIDPENAPLHTFIFKYRKILEALDILPSAPIPHDELEDSTPSTPSSDEEDEDEDIDPMEKIERLKNELRQFKRKVKEEPRTSPELVDLTQPAAKKRRILVDLTA